MAGLPFLLGFVAKETLLDAMLHYSAPWTQLVMIMVIVSTAFTAMAAYMLIYDVFLEAPALIAFTFISRHPGSGSDPRCSRLALLSLGFLLEPIDRTGA